MAFGGSKVVEYIIRAKDATAEGVRGALGRLKGFGSGVKSMAQSARNALRSIAAPIENAFSKVGGALFRTFGPALNQLANIKAGFDMVVGAAQRMASIVAGAIKAAFKFEKAVTDFKVLTGSIDTAKQHIADLKAFAASTPLTFDDLSKASKLLLSFGASLESVMPNLKMLGDISMGDAQKFQGLALVFAQVQSAGKLMGQDLLQMINQGFNPLTVISQQTGQSMSELKDIMAEGGISFDMVAEAMRVATSEGGLFFNAMEEGSKTGEGLMSTLQDNWSESVRQFGSAFMDAAKNGLQFLIGKLQTLNRDGSIEMWAERALEMLGKVKEVLQGMGTAINWVWQKAGLGDAYHWVAGEVAGLSAGAGALVGGIESGRGWKSFGDAAREAHKATMAERSKGYWTGKAAERGWLGKDAKDAVDERNAKADAREQKRAKIASEKAAAARNAEIKAEEEKTSAAEAEESKRKTLAEQMAEYKAKREEEAAKKAAEKAAEEERRLQERLAAEQQRQLEQLERERERLAQKAFQKEVQLAQDAVSESVMAETAAQSRLTAARSQVAQAWGWYRDKDSMQAHIDDVLEQRQAEKDWEKDFKRLQSKFRGDTWKDVDIGKLSAAEEATRQVALAKEEERAAQKALDAIEANTRDLAAKLDELLTMKEA